MPRRDPEFILTYGTLRKDAKRAFELPQGIEFVQTEHLEDASLYDLGWFPGIKLSQGGGSVVCDRFRIVDRKALPTLDRYEGFYPDNIKASLYIRRVVGDAYIYEFNREVSKANPLIENGDWVEYYGARKTC